MASIGGAYGRLRDQVRGYAGLAADFLAGAGLWVLVVGFTVWSFVDKRDAFVTGIVTGSVFALGAIGLTLIYGVLKFGHFAHGDSMMLAAFVAFLLLSGTVVGSRAGEDTEALPLHLSDLPGAADQIWDFSFGYGLLAAMLLASVVMAGLFIVLDRLVYRPLRQRKSGIVIYSIASLGLALGMRSLIFIIWGSDNRFYVKGLRSSVHLPLDILVLNDQIFIFFTALGLMVLVYLLLFRTKLGKAMRAMADNPDLARVSGINTEQVVLWTWAVSGALVAVAGVMLALQAQLDPNLGFVILLPLFAATILGGIGSPQGALIGGFLIGVIQEVAVAFEFSITQYFHFDSGYKFSVAFMVLILILLIKPRGLLGPKI